MDDKDLITDVTQVFDSCLEIRNPNIEIRNKF